MVTLRQLRYLEALARHRHFGRAAEACAVTQPALSMQVRELEGELDAVLVERRPGRPATTRKVFIAPLQLPLRSLAPLADPDQNSVELNINNYRNEWTATERMRNKATGAGLPKRAFVDPEKLLAARVARATAALMARFPKLRAGRNPFRCRQTGVSSVTSSRPSASASPAATVLASSRKPTV
jgi:DNA-binding transcriptional LysR family regulator